MNIKRRVIQSRQLAPIGPSLVSCGRNVRFLSAGPSEWSDGTVDVLIESDEIVSNGDARTLEFMVVISGMPFAKMYKYVATVKIGTGPTVHILQKSEF